LAIDKIFSSADNLKAVSVGAEIAVGTIAGPASYAAGGFDADVQTDLGLSGTESAVQVTSSNGLPCAFASDKILVYGAVASNAATEIADTTDLSGVTFTVVAVYKA
jgi:hypothetical protein